ncbi:HNH endonuclease signature motif containing protein [[Mycobacterium] wendilense]|uniref:DUF222 domain-containing protein n=1 Tax=[Mycobacterium] wendilense TaxID=3064284 RepID=A0ABM9MH63_9MYCO|nr:DUF222 domain-containing protein [Mycolicibacterium sp. MU0050]CAJ1585100.1 DUF222 domain-containing protein [Mycolicibacterium sp. MU0050]
MFDGSLPEPASLPATAAAALVDAITGWSTAAAAADGRRLAAIAEFVTRRCTDEHPDWACDDWDATAAEIAAALNISHGRANSLMNLAITLRQRLPKVGALLLAGAITARTAQLISDRTYLVFDPEAVAALDARIAADAVSWGPLSEYKLIQAVDARVQQIDPGAIRQATRNARNRDVTFADPDEHTGTTAMWGRLLATDAALLDTRLTAMANAVCPEDPRTIAQRRSDALGALGARSQHLACLCGSPDCPAATDDGRATSVVVHVVAEQEAVAAPGEPAEPSLHGLHATSEPTPRPDPAEPTRPAPALLVEGRGGVVPVPLLTDLIARGAKVRPLITPTEAEPRYRPSSTLATFVRLRDLTCRFPGCDRPAFRTDIDHTRPYPQGLTHAANLGCYCRKHHLLKTFWPGWTDEQLPDGTIVFTTPTGHTYRSKPGATLLFPDWPATPAPAEPARPGPPPRSLGRTLLMPTRSQTRAKARRQRIKSERALNDEAVAERCSPPPF